MRGKTLVLRLIFSGYVPLASQSPYPIIVYSVVNYRPPSWSLLGKYVIFHDPNVVTFFLCICLIMNEEHSTSHLQCKHSGMFANRKYEELSYTKNQKMCDPILVNYCIENATPI